MITRAFLLHHLDCQPTSDENGDHLKFLSEVCVVGDPGIVRLNVETIVEDNDLAVIVKNKCTAAVIAAATDAGYTGLTAARILYPDLSRG